MRYKKLSVFLIIFSVTAALLSMVLTMVFSSKTVSKEDSRAVTSVGEEYILKDYDGHLAVFYSDSETPYMEFRIKTDSFEEYDRNLLERGIKAYGEEEIRQLIEDYTG